MDFGLFFKMLNKIVIITQSGHHITSFFSWNGYSAPSNVIKNLK